jgi:extradiol dioxygenase family protein
MRLDHITIVAPDCACLRDFFVEIAGMEEGARPAFAIGGHWLYLHHQPVLHLIERPDVQSTIAPDTELRVSRSPARIDHMALRIDNAVEWQTLLRRLRDRQIPYRLSGIGALQEQQLFVTPMPQVTVEFVIEERHLR